ncbi:DMT family transporter [Pseudorhodoplanes sp.]|uniref:DMT family transporter n=1 Tax=Pseudorhodoplanes sp. TaxID=1934341 RepID=UPI002BBB1626|nr:DMT family transporter [Pseudorhodoplanes sp.]HWV42455.1 DMT family transporter [Pseudorhodoplanes sp.]
MTSTTQHNAATRPLELGAAALVVFLCLCWGFNQVAVKLALADIPPLTQAWIRSAGAALLIWIYARSRGISLEMRGETLKAGLIAGVLFGLEFIFIYRSLLFTTASRTTLFIYCAPFVVVLGSHFLVRNDRFRWTQWAGLLMSFAGVMLAFGVPTPAENPHQLFGDLLALAAGVAWGLTTLVVKSTSLARAAPEKTLQYQLLVSVPMLVISAWLFGETVTKMPGTVALASLAYQTIWVVSLTFLLWFMLVAKYSASRLSSFTFLTPLFGVFAGHMVLGDPITLAFAGAVTLVIGGLILVNRPR